MKEETTLFQFRGPTALKNRLRRLLAEEAELEGRDKARSLTEVAIEALRIRVEELEQYVAHLRALEE